eukprot:g20886.t2
MKPGHGSGSGEPTKPKFRPKAQARKKPAPPPPPVNDYREAAANYRSGRGGGGGAEGEPGAHDRGGAGGGGYDGEAEGVGGGDETGTGDFFVGGGGSGPTAYIPSGVSSVGGEDVDGRGRGRGGGDTSESEDEQDRRRRRSKSKKAADGATKEPKSEHGMAKEGAKGSSSSAHEGAARRDGDFDADADDDIDEDMFGVGEPISKATASSSKGEDEDEDDEDGKGDLFSLIGADVRRRPKSVKLPGMRVTGNVMSEEDSMRPVALPVTAMAQTPGTRLFAQANNQAELTEEEDSSLFFVQLPTKLPRPLPAFQRAGGSAAKDGSGGVSSSAAGAGKGKGKGKASGHLVKEELGDSASGGGGGGGGGGGAAGGGGMGKGGAGAEQGKAIGMPIEDPAFDQGLRRMRPGKIGKLYVHQSGKARLLIGGVSLVVHPGLPVSFLEQGVSIDSDKRTFCSFGQVTKRAVCTPDFEQLYRRADESDMSGVGFEGGPQVDGAGAPVKMEVA